MRRLLPLLLLLTGCGSPVWSDLGGRVAGELQALSPWARDEPEAAAPAGESLRLRLGGRVVHAALVQQRGPQRLWRTGAGVTLATEGGRITATVGLRQILAGTRFDGPDPLLDPAPLLDRPAIARRLVDLMRSSRAPDDLRFGVAVDCVLRAERTEVAGVLLVREACEAPGLGLFEEDFSNLFWVAEAGGAVLRAEQWVGPGVPAVLAEFLPAED